MTAARAMALGLTDFSFFSPPPRRPSRPAVRTRRAGFVTSMLRTIRTELDRATRVDATILMPRLSDNYPY